MINHSIPYINICNCIILALCCHVNILRVDWLKFVALCIYIYFFFWCFFFWFPQHLQTSTKNLTQRRRRDSLRNMSAAPKYQNHLVNIETIFFYSIDDYVLIFIAYIGVLGWRTSLIGDVLSKLLETNAPGYLVNV